MKLVIATPSPYARKVRIALIEKGLPHEIVVDNPWTQGAVREWNPLGKVPALLLDGGRVVHDSKVIFEYLETLGAEPALLPRDPGLRVTHKQVEATADGICDAVVLIVAERGRPADKQSEAWIARQARKVPAALDELETLLGGTDAFTPHGYGLAEIATGCALGYLDLRDPEHDWRAAHAGLVRLKARLDARPSFATTVPVAQAIAAG